MIDRAGVDRWSAMLRGAAARTLPEWSGVALGTPFGDEERARRIGYVGMFRDDRGTRRALDVLLLSAVLGLEPGGPDARERTAERAWRIACAPWRDGDALFSAIPSLSGAGPLAPEHREDGIEAWTEQELATLHAVERIGRATGRAALRARVDDAVRWHLEHMQPDNGTNRPWAIGVFLRSGSPEAVFHAETMLHACVVERGRADLVSAWILLDAAAGLAAGLAAGPAEGV